MPGLTTLTSLIALRVVCDRPCGDKKSLKVSRPKINVAANGKNRLLNYNIVNSSRITAAFAIRAQLLNGSGKQILPALFSDGYFSLMQGESKTLIIEVDPKLLGANYKLDLKAFNN